MAHWSIGESVRLYNLNNWGADFFSVNKQGNVCVHPSPNSVQCIELISLVVPDELRNFQVNLRQNCFANFSLFQSLPDSWAIDQLFPVMPLQRLDQKPEVVASVADLTCDSDGEITSFVGEKGRKDFRRCTGSRPARSTIWVAS